MKDEGSIRGDWVVDVLSETGGVREQHSTTSYVRCIKVGKIGKRKEKKREKEKRNQAARISPS